MPTLDLHDSSFRRSPTWHQDPTTPFLITKQSLIPLVEFIDHSYLTMLTINIDYSLFKACIFSYVSHSVILSF
jgi:hypothetical protein